MKRGTKYVFPNCSTILFNTLLLILITHMTIKLNLSYRKLTAPNTLPGQNNLLVYGESL